MILDELVHVTVFGIPPGVTLEQAGPAAGAAALFIFLCLAVVCMIRSSDRRD